MALSKYSRDALEAVEAVFLLGMGKALNAAAQGKLLVDTWSSLSMILTLATGEVPDNNLMEEVRLMVMVELFPEA